MHSFTLAASRTDASACENLLQPVEVEREPFRYYPLPGLLFNSPLSALIKPSCSWRPPLRNGGATPKISVSASPRPGHVIRASASGTKAAFVATAFSFFALGSASSMRCSTWATLLRLASSKLNFLRLLSYGSLADEGPCTPDISSTLEVNRPVTNSKYQGVNNPLSYQDETICCRNCTEIAKHIYKNLDIPG